MTLYADFLVSDDFKEIMLVIDWLTRNKCQWHLVEKEIDSGYR